MRAGALVTDRDIALLRSLCDYGVLTVDQLRRLHFPSQQTANRRIRRLSRAGLLRCAQVKGHVERVVLPTEAGLAAGGIESHRAEVGRLPAPLFLRHSLAVSEFRIALTRSLRAHQDTELVNFVGDAERHLPRPGMVPQSPLRAEVLLAEGAIAHAPDAAFALRRAGRLAAFYVELDLGTEVVGAPRRGVGKFVRFYRACLTRDAYRWLATALQLERQPDAVRVLVVTTTPRRVHSIRRISARETTDPTDLRIWMADAAVLAADILEPAWLTLDPTSETRQAIVVPPGFAP